MSIAKKHVKRINELLNSEQVAHAAIDRTPTTDAEKMAFWVKYGHASATELYTEFGIMCGSGSLKYWDAMMHTFVRQFD